MCVNESCYKEFDFQGTSVCLFCSVNESCYEEFDFQGTYDCLFCRKICACKKDIEELLPQLEQCVKDILTNAERVINYQKQRQTSVWRLLEVAVSLLFGYIFTVKSLVSCDLAFC